MWAARSTTSILKPFNPRLRIVKPFTSYSNSNLVTLNCLKPKRLHFLSKYHFRITARSFSSNSALVVPLSQQLPTQSPSGSQSNVLISESTFETMVDNLESLLTRFEIISTTQNALLYLHDLGLPWWLAIPLFSSCIRLATIPLSMLEFRVLFRFRAINFPEFLKPFQADVKEGKFGLLFLLLRLLLLRLLLLLLLLLCCCCCTTTIRPSKFIILIENHRKTIINNNFNYS